MSSSSSFAAPAHRRRPNLGFPGKSGGAPSPSPPASSAQAPQMSGTRRPEAPTDYCNGASSSSRHRTARLDTAPRRSRCRASRCATPVAGRKEHTGGSSKAEPEWASLPQDLVRVIADCVLSTSGVVAYMDLRALCPSWRSAIAKPSPSQAVMDARFFPRQWVMLDMEDMDVPRVAIGSRARGVVESHARAMIDDWARATNQHRLFLNVSTGCFLRLRLPLLRRNILVGASDGLLILAHKNKPHATRLLNPFTGDMLPFAAPPVTRKGRVFTAVAGSGGTLLLSFLGLHGLYCADPSSHLCKVQTRQFFSDDDYDCGSLVSYGGHVYMARRFVVKIVGTSPHYHDELIADIFTHSGRNFLVESAGELLLVHLRNYYDVEFQPPELFRVDVEQKVLEPVKDIGGRALFLGATSVSVDADKLPSIGSNCIYYRDDNRLLGSCSSGFMYDRSSSFFMYDLKDGKEKKRRRYLKSGSETGRHVRPTLAQTLIEYCSFNADCALSR